ncbi:MAG: GxxExxY protein [Bacteroidetes bacterium]|nr:GxxExxY protein [Bacteroidota bacterium]
MTIENELATQVIGICLDVHRQFGPGLFEKMYEEIVAHSCRTIGLYVEQQKPIWVIYNGQKIGPAYKADIVVEDKLLLEIKSVTQIEAIHRRQIISYLKLGDYKLGLLINFNETLLKNGIHRFINSRTY